MTNTNVLVLPITTVIVPKSPRPSEKKVFILRTVSDAVVELRFQKMLK